MTKTPTLAKCAVAAAISMTLLWSSVSAAYADDGGSSVDVVSDTTQAQADAAVASIASADPAIATATSDATTVAPDGTTVTRDGGLTPVVPSDGSPISVTTSTGTSVSLDVTPASTSQATVSNGISVYADGNQTVAVQPVAVTDGGGVRGIFIMSNSGAPTDHQVNLQITGGGSLALQSDGSVALTTGDGSSAGSVGIPWATAADGSTVPTWYTVNGTTLTQHVDTRSVTAWPVTSDPWWHPDYVGSVRWVTLAGNPGPTLQVYPTAWGRTMATFDRSGSFAEVQRKAGRSLNNSMYNQFLCHADWWPLKNLYGDKEADRLHAAPTWNLDTWRPDVGYWTTVYRKCNP